MHTDTSKSLSASRTNRFQRLFALLLSLLLFSGAAMSGCSQSQASADSAGAGSAGIRGASESAPVERAEEKMSGILSFMLHSDDWSHENDGALIVHISGTTEQGENVSEQYKAEKPDQKYNTTLPAGEYEVKLAKPNAASGDRLFKAELQKASFDGRNDKTIAVRVTLDAEAMAAAEAAAKAAEEQRLAQERAAAEEAQRQAEAAAAAEAQRQAEAAAAAEAQRRAEAEAAQANSYNGATVYVAASGKGKKYHSNPNCSNMKGTKSMSVAQAESAGYTPCKKCY